MTNDPQPTNPKPNRGWFKPYTIPERDPDRTCNARMRTLDGQEVYCQVETNGQGRCLTHDPYKKRLQAAQSGLKRLMSTVKAALAGQSQPLWEEEPVDIQTFCTEFLGEPLFPVQLELAEALVGKDPRTWDTTHNEALALWGMGSGKDKTAAKIMAYLTYKLLCLENPQQFLGLGIRDKIDLVNVAPTANHAEEVFFREFKVQVLNATNPKTGQNWFEEHGLDLKQDIKAREITFPKQITAYSRNGEEFTAIGFNVLLAIFDEVGAFDPRKARDLYDSLKLTARSRFPKHLKLLLLSYKYHDQDFMQQRVQEAPREQKTFLSGPHASWVVNPKLTQEDFLEAYRRDPDNAQRVYECTGTSRENRYFSDPSRLRAVFSPTWENPVSGERLGTQDLPRLGFKPWFKPKTGRGYFIHLDLAKGQTGFGGFAMGHFEREMVASVSQDFLAAQANVSGLSLDALRQQYQEKKGGVVIDLVLQLRAGPGKELFLEDVEQFILRLKKEGWPIKQVSCDWWQSVGLIQGLKRAGIDASELSVQKTTDAYDRMKSLIYSGLFVCYPHPILLRELEELIVTQQDKIDHPAHPPRRSLEEDGSAKGSKDVADAVAGCTYLCDRYGKSSFSCGVLGAGIDLPTEMRPSPTFNPLRKIGKHLVRRGERDTEYWYGTIVEPDQQKKPDPPDKKDDQPRQHG